MKTLSILIPIRTSNFDFYRKRLELRDQINLEGIETIVIDDGSPKATAIEINNFCIDRSYRYIRIESEDLIFSLSRARNRGIKEASTNWVYMEDADLAYPHNFFQQLIEQLNWIETTPFNFISIPAIYLTNDATNEVYENRGLDNLKTKFITKLLLEDPKGSNKNLIIDAYAPASGIIAVKKEIALSVGGYDENFSGWGGEDRDFIFRLLCSNNKMKLPSRFSETKSWDLNDTIAYEGWRALHRLHGEFMARHGMYAFHLYHEKLPWRGNLSSAANMRLAERKARQFDQSALGQDGKFEFRYTVLFDGFRCCELLPEDQKRKLLDIYLNKASKIRDKTQGKKRPLIRKIRKLIISPINFIEDSGSPILITLAKIMRRR